MLTKLTVSNFALIDELTVAFEPGFCIVTGETGAGKSIILGALSLILGARADSSTLRDPEKKSVVEGHFRIENYGLEPFFTENDLDYEPLTILRREIAPSGKSRAFINDTPVNLQQLRELSLRLVDIHSQYQNLELNSQQFQLQLVDTVAQSEIHLKKYHQCFLDFTVTRQKLDELREKAVRSRADLDYFQFQYSQLDEARLEPNEQEQLEEERSKLEHAEEIKSTLVQVSDLLDGERFPVVQQVKEAVHRLDRIGRFMKEAAELHQRLQSVHIELADIAREITYLSESAEFNPQRLESVTARLDLIYTLQQKHQLSSVAELLELKTELARKIEEITDYDHEITRIEKELAGQEKRLNEAAGLLSRQRKSAFQPMERQVVEILHQLGMPHAVFRVAHEPRVQFTPTGTDNIRFLFSANRDARPDDITRIASGGEISRVMLALKTLVTGSKMLPTIIFDEIDTGISGEIALKMGQILKTLSAGMQVINITHLPQIAGKGEHHYLVFKTESEAGTFTSVRKLSEQERVEELAKMVGGDNPSATALQAARELLET